MKGAAQLSQHIPSPAPALTPADLKIVCDYLSSAGDCGLPVQAALHAFYDRAISCHHPLLWPAHLIGRDDIKATNGGLDIIIRSSKTLVRSSLVALHVEAIPTSPYCLSIDQICTDLTGGGHHQGCPWSCGPS